MNGTGRTANGHGNQDPLEHKSKIPIVVVLSLFFYPSYNQVSTDKFKVCSVVHNFEKEIIVKSLHLEVSFKKRG